jgi:hypothetical protein
MALLSMKLFKMGFTVYCPLLTHFLDYIHPMGYEDWLAFDMEWMRRCDVLVWDAAECPGVSAGAEREIAEMRRIGKPVFRSVEELVHAFCPPQGAGNETVA